MTDVAITGNDVVAGANSQQTAGTLGGTCVAGDILYQSPDDHRWRRASNNSGTVGAKVPGGMALSNGANNQPVRIHKRGDVTLTPNLVAGTAYYLSSSAGKICPRTDVVTGMDVVFIGIARSTTVLAVQALISGVTL